jgi:hypothetical protein
VVVPLGMTTVGLVLLIWAGVLGLLVGALALATGRRRRPSRAPGERRAATVRERRTGSGDRRMGLPDVRSERVERRASAGDRRSSVSDRRRVLGPA